MQKKIIIVSDSSANLYQADCADFMPVPLKILAGEKEFVDDEALDVAGMLAYLREYKGRSSTSCPGVGLAASLWRRRGSVLLRNSLSESTHRANRAFEKLNTIHLISRKWLGEQK